MKQRKKWYNSLLRSLAVALGVSTAATGCTTLQTPPQNFTTDPIKLTAAQIEKDSRDNIARVVNAACERDSDQDGCRRPIGGVLILNGVNPPEWVLTNKDEQARLQAEARARAAQRRANLLAQNTSPAITYNFGEQMADFFDGLNARASSFVNSTPASADVPVVDAGKPTTTADKPTATLANQSAITVEADHQSWAAQAGQWALNHKWELATSLVAGVTVGFAKTAITLAFASAATGLTVPLAISSVGALALGGLGGALGAAIRTGSHNWRVRRQVAKKNAAAGGDETIIIPEQKSMMNEMVKGACWGAAGVVIGCVGGVALSYFAPEWTHNVGHFFGKLFGGSSDAPTVTPVNTPTPTVTPVVHATVPTAAQIAAAAAGRTMTEVAPTVTETVVAAVTPSAAVAPDITKLISAADMQYLSAPTKALLHSSKPEDILRAFKEAEAELINNSGHRFTSIKHGLEVLKAGADYVKALGGEDYVKSLGSKGVAASRLLRDFAKISMDRDYLKILPQLKMG